MLKEDEWIWQECGKMKAATVRMAELAGWPVGFLPSAGGSIRSQLREVFKRRRRSKFCGLTLKGGGSKQKKKDMNRILKKCFFSSPKP